MTISIEPMTKENIENMFKNCELLASILNFPSYEAMEKFKINASLGMLKFGGSFLQGLGNALAHADSMNTAKIIRSFFSECKEHANLYIKWLANRGQDENGEFFK